MQKHGIAVFLTVCIFLNNLLSAQSTRPGRMEIGIIAGPTIDWCKTSTYEHTSKGAKVGGVYGVNTDINLVQTSSNYYFATGINVRHIRYGLKYTDNYSFFNYEIQENDTVRAASINSAFNTVYICIPTAIKLKTNEFNQFVFWGLLGMEHGIAVSSKSNDVVKNTENEEVRDFARVNRYKNTAILKESIYFIVGAEYIINNGTKLIFGIGYDHGVNNMFRKEYKNSISNAQIKAHTHRIEFQFGVIF